MAPLPARLETDALDVQVAVGSYLIHARGPFSERVAAGRSRPRSCNSSVRCQAEGRCNLEPASRVRVGPVVVVSGDARGRRQQHGDHGGPAEHAQRAFARLGRRGMGGQRLSGGVRGVHRARRPGGGPVRRTAGIDGRPGAVRRRILHHRRRRRAARAAGRPRLAGPRGSVRGAEHPGCDRYRRAAASAGRQRSAPGPVS